MPLAPVGAQMMKPCEPLLPDDVPPPLVPDDDVLDPREEELPWPPPELAEVELAVDLVAAAPVVVAPAPVAAPVRSVAAPTPFAAVVPPVEL